MSVEQPQQQAKPADSIGFGIAMAATGLYIIGVALGLLPMPDGGAGAPPFVIVLAGLTFVFVGCSLAIRAHTGARDTDGDLPKAAPAWAKMSYRIIAIAITGSLASIGTWVAIGGDPRKFSVSGPIGSIPAGETIGRAVFALGAVIVWIYVIALTVGTVRKLFDRGER